MPDAPTPYRSHAHPGSDPWPLVYGRALLQPLSVCMLPVMIGSLVAVLERLPLTPYVWWASGLALGCATAWTAFRQRALVAEVVVEADRAAVRTVHEVAAGASPAAWGPVLDVRDYGKWSLVTVGLTSYELERADWPAYDGLIAALRAARLRHLAAPAGEAPHPP